MSSELAHRISLLKGNRSSADIVKGADVSRETFRKIERGESVKLSTVLKIAEFLDADKTQRNEIVVAWFKLEAGDEAKHIRFTFENSALSDKSDEAAQIASLVSQLDTMDRKQIIMALTRPEVRRVLPSLNSLHDSLKRRA